MATDDDGARRYGVRKGAWRLNRCRKSCSLRWLNLLYIILGNYPKPYIKRGEFSLDEDDLLMRLHKLLGNRRSLIAGRLPGRTANDVKNHWNKHFRKKTASGQRFSTDIGKSIIITPTTSTAASKEGHDHMTSFDLFSTKEDVLEQMQCWKSLLDDQVSDQEVAAVSSGSCSVEAQKPENGLTELSFDIEMWDFLDDEWLAVTTRKKMWIAMAFDLSLFDL
uniref:Uncharacterized protein n=1 Tax=Kalanchoe fedtschenkoi TaxID=63787 RepID=A0A7N0VHU7_KALFE